MKRHERSINALIIMRDSSGDPRQKQALQDAIDIMREAGRYYDKAWLRGYREGRIKGATE